MLTDWKPWHVQHAERLEAEGSPDAAAARADADRVIRKHYPWLLSGTEIPEPIPTDDKAAKRREYMRAYMAAKRKPLS